MTQGAIRIRSPRWGGLLLLALVFTALLSPPGGRAEDPEADPWVAHVGDRTLFLSRLADTVAWRMRYRLQEAGSGPTTILRQMIEERAVTQEATRLGLRVMDREVEDKYGVLDGKVRSVSGGNKTLEDEIRNQRSTVQEFKTNLRHQILKEKIAGHPTNLGETLPTDDDARRIAQTEVVITELLKRTDVQYGWKTALQEEPTPMDAEMVATVRVHPDALPAPDAPKAPGEPITAREYGEELVRRLPSADIREIIQEECKAALTGEVALSVEDMTKVIAEEQERWNQWRELATQEAYRHVSYDEYVKMRYQLDLDQMRQDRYFRGLFGLILQERRKLEPGDIQAEWEKNKEGLYGDAILVTDVEILFSPQNPLLGDRGGRGRKDALKLANDFLRQVSAGKTFDEMVRFVNAQKNPTLRGRRFRVRNTSTGRLLFERAQEMEDGQVSRPFETLSEVHVLRRDEFIPAPPFEEVRDMIREGLAQRRAHDWLQKQIESPDRVQIRWPLPD